MPPAKKGRGRPRKRTAGCLTLPKEKLLPSQINDLVKKNKALEKEIKKLDDMYVLLSETVNNLNHLIESLVNTNAKQCNITNPCKSYANIVKQKLPPTNPSPHVRYPSKTPTVKCYAVIENLPDSKRDDQIVKDKDLIQKLFNVTNFKLPSNWFRINCKNPNIYSRPLKIEFTNEVERLKFIKTFRSAFNKLSDRPLGTRTIRCRRDMNASELQVLKENRAKVYNMNNEAKLLKYYVRDLEIVESLNPRPLPQSL